MTTPGHPNAILHLGLHIGFAGGIERYAWQTAQTLAAHGFVNDYAGAIPSRDPERFAAAFRRILTPEQALDAKPDDYQLVILHKLCPSQTLRKLRQTFGERLVFLAHDHDLHCARRHYYTPLGRLSCHEPRRFLHCTLCALLSHPRNWQRSPLEASRLLDELRHHRAIVLSAFMRDCLVRNGFDPAAITVIHPFALPAPSPRADFLPDGQLRLLFAGQLIRGKGADLLLEALAKLKVPWQLTIAGDGPERPRLEQQAQHLGLHDRIVFPGWLQDLRQLHQHADLLVVPSLWQEPFGLVGLEAAANGLPAIAFDVGGIPEWLHDGHNGILVPERDTDALAGAIARCHDWPDMLASMSANALRLVQEQFSVQQFVHAYAQLLHP
ncbi:MAG: glycosyltransferase family 4 protein [Oligosphaeraceae bacterium]